jgi:hypothetical protein
LRAVARGLAVEHRLAASPADGEALSQWRAHVAEATKPVPPARDAFDDLVDAHLTVPA